MENYNKAKMATAYYESKFNAGWFERIKNVSKRFFSTIFSSLPISTFLGGVIGLIAVVGLIPVLTILLMNMILTGLPIVLFIRWMMKKQRNNQPF